MRVFFGEPVRAVILLLVSLLKRRRFRAFLLLSGFAGLAGPVPVTATEILGSKTYRPDIVGKLGVVAAGRHFAAEAGMQMLHRGGNAIDAGVAATFAAAVTEISHFGLGGEAPIVLYSAKADKVIVISGQGVAPAAATVKAFPYAIPTNGPSAGTVPAVVDALAIALAEFGTLSLSDVLQPAISLADGFPWYPFLGDVLRSQLKKIRRYPSGARVYLQGPDNSVPPVGSLFRQPQLAATLRLLVDTERNAAQQGRKAAIYAARDRFYRGDIARRIATAVQRVGGLLSAQDLATYRGRLETPERLDFYTGQSKFSVFKTGFWGQGPVLLQTLALLQGFDLAALEHNSAAYIHTVTEALKLALADRDAFYGDPDFSAIPAQGLLSPEYAAKRRSLIDPENAVNYPRPGNPWPFDKAKVDPGVTDQAQGPETDYRENELLSPDTTGINIVDQQGNLFSTAPSSAWFYGGVFIAGDTGIPLGNRMQAFVLETAHPNQVQGGKRPRTTLSPTVILLDDKPFMAMSTPGGDSQDQQLLQVLLNIAVFGMSPQQAVEAPRFNSLQYHQSFGDHRIRPGILMLEDRISQSIINQLAVLGHRVKTVGAFMITGAVTLAGKDHRHDTLFGAADVRGQRYIIAW